MADAFTPNFDLVLPEIGGSLDTWGAKLNENFSEVDGRLIPSGLIAMWSGTVGAVPEGWALCDGTSGTPDLRGRFIVGAGGNYSVGDTGGAESVTLTTAQMPSHSHSGSTGAHTHSHSASTGSAGSHSHSGTANSAGAHTHNQIGPRYNSSGGSYNSNGRENRPDGNTYPTSSAGAHTHSLSINSSGAHTHSVSVSSNTHSHSVSISSQGGGESHENRPPYYALAYIMKL